MTLFSCIPRAKSSKSFFMTVRGPGKRLILPRQKIRDNNKTARIIKVPDSEIHRKMVQVRFHERKKKKKEKKKRGKNWVESNEIKSGMLKEGTGSTWSSICLFLSQISFFKLFSSNPWEQEERRKIKKAEKLVLVQWVAKVLLWDRVILNLGCNVLPVVGCNWMIQFKKDENNYWSWVGK
jgi:hypothetical protein